MKTSTKQALTLLSMLAIAAAVLALIVWVA